MTFDIIYPMNLKKGIKFWQKLSLRTPHPKIKSQGDQSFISSLKSSSDSSIRNREEHQFYHNLIHINQTLNIQITHYEVCNSSYGFTQNYVKYFINIVTDHITFECKRRYSEFLHFYKIFENTYDFVNPFPAKTHIHSKISQDLSNKRKELLNKFITQIMHIPSKFQIILIEFLKFLNIKQEYERLGIFQQIISIKTEKSRKNSEISIQQKLTSSYCISHEIVKINLNTEESYKVLKKLEILILNANKNNIKMEDLKFILLGTKKNQKTKGLIQIALSCSEQQEDKCKEILRVLLNFMNYAKCSSSQAFLRVVQNIPSKTMRFLTPIRNKPEIQQEYFQLINIYFMSRLKVSDIPENILHLQVFPQKQFYDLFLQWQKNRQNIDKFMRRNLKKLDVSIFPTKQIEQKNGKNQQKQHRTNSRTYLQNEQIFTNQVQQLLKHDGRQMQKYGYSLLFKSEEEDLWGEVSNNQKFLHFHKKLKQQKLCVLIEQLKGWKHNSLITSWYPEDSITPFGKLFVKIPHKHQRYFQIKMNSYVSNHILQKGYDCLKKEKKDMIQSFQTCDSFSQADMLASIICEPVENLSPEKSFFFCASISGKIESQEQKLDIVYYFYEQKTRKYFNSELKGNTKYMWESFMSFRQKTNPENEK